MCSITRQWGGNHTHVIDDDDDDDEDVYIYLADMHLDEWDACRVVVYTVIEWDQQQYETFVENKCKPGKSSRSSDA